MPDFVEVAVYPLTSLPTAGAALLFNGVAVGKSSRVLACAPEPLSHWRSRPNVGSEYVLEGTPVDGGARMAFRASCSFVAAAVDETAEFVIGAKI